MNGQDNATNAQNVTLWRRFAVIIYDGILLAAVLFFMATIPTVIFEITRESPLYPILIVYIYGMAFLYFGWFWTRGGQTLAMKTWNIRIESDEYTRVTWKQALIRFSVAIISWLPLGLGYLWTLIRKDSASWHDLASKTHLVQLPKQPY